MISIVGKTFEHREYLKRIGAKWDGTEKRWTLADADDAIRNELVCRGLTLRGTGRDVPGKGPQPDMPAEPVSRVPPTIPGPDYGDDLTYRERFSSRQTLAYFGFSSLAAHIDYVRNLPANISEDNRDSRNIGWRHNSKFSGTEDMQQALSLATDGWQQGVENAAAVLEMLTAGHAKQRRPRHTLAGGHVNVGRMLAGNPVHMRRRVKQDGREVKTLFVDSGSRSTIPADLLIARAAIVAALADMLENNGYSCEIVAVNCPTARDHTTHAYQIATRVKAAGEKFNIEDVVFALGHPSYLRRVIFATVASAENCRSIWSFMGVSTSMFRGNHTPNNNEFYIPKIETPLGGVSIFDKVRNLLPFIVPPNFPIKVTNAH